MFATRRLALRAVARYRSIIRPTALHTFSYRLEFIHTTNYNLKVYNTSCVEPFSWTFTHHLTPFAIHTQSKSLLYMPVDAGQYANLPLVDMVGDSA